MNEVSSNLKDLRKTFMLDKVSFDEIDIFKRIHRLKSESEALRSIIAEYKVLKEQQKKPLECASPSEKQAVDKALGLADYPKDCHDMVSIEGKPTLRQCLCPNSKRPIALSSQNGKFIVDNPQICWRCRALGYRNIKEPQKHTQFNGGSPIQKAKKQDFGTKAYFGDGHYSNIDDRAGVYQ